MESPKTGGSETAVLLQGETMSKHIVVFGYDFPHEKTSRGLLALKQAGYDCLVLAAPHEKLSIRDAGRSWGMKGLKPHHPQQIANICEFQYHVINHKKAEAIKWALLTLLGYIPSTAVILGARIIPEDVIGIFRKGIINAHPAKLPQCRGLIAPKLAVLKNIPPLITYHLIDKHIDKGKFLYYQRVPIYKADTQQEFKLRSLHYQVEGMPYAIELLSKTSAEHLPKLGGDEYPNKGITPEDDKLVDKTWTSYCNEFSED